MQAGDVEGKPALLRRTVRSIDFAANPEEDELADTTSLLDEAPAFLYFDGGNYSYSDLDLGARSLLPLQVFFHVCLFSIAVLCGSCFICSSVQEQRSRWQRVHCRAPQTPPTLSSLEWRVQPPRRQVAQPCLRMGTSLWMVGSTSPTWMPRLAMCRCVAALLLSLRPVATSWQSQMPTAWLCFAIFQCAAALLLSLWPPANNYFTVADAMFGNLSVHPCFCFWDALCCCADRQRI